MATFDGKFLRGILGPVVLRQQGNKQVISTMPEPGSIKQTDATKVAANTFGMASNLGSKIRDLLYYELSTFKDGTTHFRLNTALNHLLQDCRDNESKAFSFETDSLHGLAGFELNKFASMNKKLPVKPEVSIDNGSLQLTFPTGQTPRRLKFVTKCTACNLIFSVMLFRLHDGLVSREAERQSVMVQKDSPVLDGMTCSFEVPNDCLCLVAVTLHYYNGNIPITDIKHNRSAICDALFVPGIYDDDSEFLWAENEVVF